MKGAFQTLIQRAISSGLYFPLEDIFRYQVTHVYPNIKDHRTIHSFLAGTLAGMFNGIIMNPASSVKVTKYCKIIHL
jgi:hypothetical protein